jgi:hypothetical protein
MTVDIAALQELPEVEPIDMGAEDGRPGMTARTHPVCNFISCIFTDI